MSTEDRGPVAGTVGAVSPAHPGFLQGWPGCARAYHPASRRNPSWDCSCLLCSPAGLPVPRDSYGWENVSWGRVSRVPHPPPPSGHQGVIGTLGSSAGHLSTRYGSVIQAGSSLGKGGLPEQTEHGSPRCGI